MSIDAPESHWHFWVALTSAIGLGSIFSAVIARTIAIAGHRQAWINALREDLAAFLKEIEAIHNAVANEFAAKTPEEVSEHEKTKLSVRLSLLLVYYRVKLRLNRKEESHQKLFGILDKFFIVKDRVPNREEVNAMVTASQDILKEEWEVTKLGPFAHSGSRKGMFRLWLVTSIIWLTVVPFVIYTNIMVLDQSEAAAQVVSDKIRNDCAEARKTDPKLGNPVDCFTSGNHAPASNPLTKENLRQYGFLEFVPPIAAIGLWFAAAWIAVGFRKPRI